MLYKLKNASEVSKRLEDPVFQSRGLQPRNRVLSNFRGSGNHLWFYAKVSSARCVSLERSLTYIKISRGSLAQERLNPASQVQHGATKLNARGSRQLP